MIAIRDTLISDEVFTRYFCCNLNKCKGCCCIEGDAGAPLEKHEYKLLEKYYPAFKEYMSEQAREIVEKKGFFEIHTLDDSFVTPLVDNRDCVYLTYGEDGIAYCAVEKAFRQGRIPFRKPVSCSLFPIRVQHYPEYDALNYFHWDICHDAEVTGKRKKIPVFRFLKESLTEYYGEEWYAEAEAVYKAVFEGKKRR